MAGVRMGREMCAWVLLISGSPRRAESSAHRHLLKAHDINQVPGLFTFPLLDTNL